MRYAAIGGSSLALPSQTAKSAQLPLLADKKYNIHVKAIRSDDHQIQSEWESLQVDTSRDLGEFFFKIMSPTSFPEDVNYQN